MPVLPLVGSITCAPGARSAPSSIAFATRSLIEPVGFCPSSFAYTRTDGRGEKCRNSTSGVLPIRSRRDEAGRRSPTGHCREEDDRRRLTDGRLEALAGANVLAFDVDVHERRDAAVVQDPRAERGEPAPEIVEHLAHRSSLGQHLALAACLFTERGWNPDDAHAGRPA